jgi:hypothetical protein
MGLWCLSRASQSLVSMSSRLSSWVPSRRLAVPRVCPLGVADSQQDSRNGARASHRRSESAPGEPNHETDRARVSCSIPAAHAGGFLCSGFGPLATRNSCDNSKAKFREPYREFESLLLRQLVSRNPAFAPCPLGKAGFRHQVHAQLA